MLADIPQQPACPGCQYMHNNNPNLRGLECKWPRLQKRINICWMSQTENRKNIFGKRIFLHNLSFFLAIVKNLGISVFCLKKSLFLQHPPAYIRLLRTHSLLPYPFIPRPIRVWGGGGRFPKRPLTVDWCHPYSSQSQDQEKWINLLLENLNTKCK